MFKASTIGKIQMLLLAVLLQQGISQVNKDYDLGAFARVLYGELGIDFVRGKTVIVHPIDPVYDISLTYTQKMVCTIISVKEKYSRTKYFTAPPDIRILSALFKKDDPTIMLIHFSNGYIDVVKLEYNEVKKEHEWVIKNSMFPDPPITNIQKVTGDALYILSNGKVYASWDTAKTWSLDSVNISTQIVSDIAVDTNYYAWIVTQNRNLYYQHPDSAVWHLNNAFTTTGFPRAVFIDRKGRMFISTSASSGRVMVSVNGGASFENMSSGVTSTITSFCDDAYGNVYALGSGSDAYRLLSFTLPWTSISDSLQALAYLPTSAKVVNALSGDSILHAATIYGTFQSTDFGTTWVPSPDLYQIRSNVFYSKVIGSKEHFLISNNLGLYRRAFGDSVWSKIFPQNGYVPGVNAVAADSAGTIYGNLPIMISPSTWNFYIMKSTDGGTTWAPDTAGHKALGLLNGTQQYDMFVEKQGTLYLGGNGILYSKKPGGVWKRDTAGLGIKSGEFIADVSLDNKKGITYIARRTGVYPKYSLAVYQRSNGDSVWNIVNTSALATSEGRLVSDHAGNIVLRTLGGVYKIWKYDGTQWTEIPLPTGLGSSPFAQMHAVDGSGVLWGSFFGGGINQGIYFTTNNGAQWKYAGLKGVGMKNLSTVNDTAYAVTLIDGVHGFTSTSTPVTVKGSSPQQPLAFQLFQNFPNPFNPATTIRYQLPVRSHVTVKVFDVLGREISILVNEQKDAGSYEVLFDGKGLSSGIYFYRLTAGEFSMTRKFILQK